MMKTMMLIKPRTVPIIPHTRLTVPQVVGIPASLDLLREIMPRIIPPMQIPRRLRIQPIIPIVSPGFPYCG